MKLSPEILVRISDHPDPNKNLYRKARAVYQNTKYNTDEAVLEIEVIHYDALKDVDGAPEDVINKTEKNVILDRVANNIERVTAQGVNVEKWQKDGDGNFLFNEDGDKIINPEWETAIPEYLWISNLPIDKNEEGKITIAGIIELPENTIIGYDIALAQYYISRFEASGLFGFSLYK